MNIVSGSVGRHHFCARAPPIFSAAVFGLVEALLASNSGVALGLRMGEVWFAGEVFFVLLVFMRRGVAGDGSGERRSGNWI